MPTPLVVDVSFETHALAALFQGVLIPGPRNGRHETQRATFEVALSQAEGNRRTLDAAHRILTGWSYSCWFIGEARPVPGFMPYQRALVAEVASSIGMPAHLLLNDVREVAERQEQAKRRQALRNLPRIYHPNGNFCESGNRFDIVFPELLRDPTLDRSAFPTCPQLILALPGGVSFRQRRGRQRYSVKAWDLFA